MRIYSLSRLFCLAGIAFSVSGSAQDTPAALGLEPGSLSLTEQFMLSRVPLLQLPDEYKGDHAPMLPVWVDNSTQPYFRPITTQSGFECGQSAGIAFNFTYEIDRLRNLPANTPDNQYPTHFTWDFLNNGDNYTGASFCDSWEIVRACGNMNVTDYGGTLNYGGYLRWISGYNAWYNGMKNRLTAVKAIRVNTPEGLQTLKYWLWNHLDGSPVGGVANFYAKYFSSTPTVLPPGTPEAGKYVQTNWGPSPSHAWTICGYNDSIRFDYNNDGQYTNHLDITGDGVVDMRDWEIGGLKFANGYAGTGWCDQGFCYLMYKTLADDIGYGGIWEHTVYVVEVKESCQPKLTMKVTLKHTSRNKLRVTVGMSTTLSATVPEYVYEYPVFNYQGGDHYMQGGSGEADKTIEFGLDLTHILSQLVSGQQVKYFLQVQENDPGNSYPGEIVQMSLVDYTSTSPQFILCPSTNVPLVNNGITRISVNHNVAFNKPVITTASLPPAQLYQLYSVQLTASGGTPPYLWDVRLSYPETLSASAFPAVTAEPLVPTNNNTGYAVKDLDFPFPFYRQVVTRLYIYADGFIVFNDMPYTWPFLIDPTLLFRQTPLLSLFMADLRLYYNQGDGIWYEGDANSATIRWQASLNNMAGTTNLNFAVKLYPNGWIEYYYGNMNYPAATQWTGGMSGGDNKNYQYSQLHNAGSIASGTLDKFTACGYPVEMTLSKSGVFSGTPQYPYFNQPVKFRVTDTDGLSSTQTLLFTTNGLLINYTLNAGGDSLVEYGDTALISISVTNLGTQAVTNINTWITESDPYISLLDSVQYIGTVPGGMTMTFPNAFSFKADPNIPDQHPFTLVFHESSAQQNFEFLIDLIAYAPEIVVEAITLDDGDNGRLDPNETSDLLITFVNRGGAKVQNLGVNLSPGDPLLTINQATGNIPLLKPDSSCQLTFNVSASPQAPFEQLYLILESLTAANGFTGSDSIWLFSGEIVEDFETGNFSKFPWYSGGDAGWNIDQFEPWEGQYAIRSGWIFEEDESHILITVNVLANGEISFWRRVSCEDDPNGTDYDYLAFFIDGEELGRWDGNLPWTRMSYPVSTGYHTFKWVYHKDYSVSAFYDCCWLDFITLPPFEGALPEISVSPSSLSKTLDPGQTGWEELLIANTGGGLLHYTVQVFDTTSTKGDQPGNLTGSSLTCSASAFVPGQVFSWTFTLYNASSDNEYIKNLRMDFPVGVTVDNASNFSGGSLGDLVYDGSTGAGITINWHGESTGGRGVVKPGETATAIVSGTIAENLTQDVFMVFAIEGDQNGTFPHLAADEIRVANEGLANSWLSVSSNTGALLTGESDAVTVFFTTDSVSSGGHFCDLLVRDRYNNITVVPVHMHVNWPVWNPGGAGTGEIHLACFPNPFRDQILIRYFLGEGLPVNLEIWSSQGTLLRTLVSGFQHHGEHRITWDGTREPGEKLPPGLYTLRLTTPSGSRTIKLIVVR